MDPTLFNDAVRAVHFLGMSLGFGVAMIADVSVARMMLRPLSEAEVRTMESFHKAITVGLILLWTSGVALLWMRTGFEPARFTPKLVTKLAVVMLLTMNAVAIGRIGIPTLHAYPGWRFGELPVFHRAQLASLGTISGACWISALALGVFSALRPLPWEVLSILVGVVYLVALVAALGAALFAPLLAMAARRIENRPRIFREGVLRS